MIEFLDLPEEIILEIIVQFLSISECINLVSVSPYFVIAYFPWRVARRQEDRDT